MSRTAEEQRERRNETQRIRRENPIVKAKIKEYRSRPAVKARAAELRRKRRAENAEAAREKERLYHAKNTDKINARKRERRAADGGDHNRRQAKYRAENADKINARKREDYSKHKEREHERMAQYRKANAPKVKEIQRKWRDQNREYTRRIGKLRREQLDDSYVKGMLTQRSILTAGDIPKSLVHAKRAEIKLRRTINDHRSNSGT